jgi:monoamine oxidase
MSRTRLFSVIQRARALARAGGRASGPSLDELLDPERPSRRSFLKGSAAAGIMLASACGVQGRSRGETPQTGGPRVAVVGAGIAGLRAAYELQRHGVRAEVYEASARTGGRIVTAKNVLAPGLVTEMGGSFINHEHSDMLWLIREFGLEVWDMATLPGTPSLYHFGGQSRAHAEVIRALQPVFRRVEADNAPDKMQAIDNMSIAQYLDKLGVTGWLRDLLRVGYVSEMGRELEDLSALNFVWSLETKATDAADWHPYGTSDMRYRVSGGNQQIVDRLAQRLSDRLHLEHRLVAVNAMGSGFRLSFDKAGGSVKDVDADFLVVAIPFTLLREVELNIELPPRKRKSIAGLRYATNAKLVAGYDQRVWSSLHVRGEVLTDQPFQCAWDNSSLQGGVPGGLTIYASGHTGRDLGSGTAAQQLEKFQPGLEALIPGCSAAHNGKVARFHWPSYAFTLGSYHSVEPGQFTEFYGAEGEPVGNMYFAGEHCATVHGGYMDGAARSGREAATAILARAVPYSAGSLSPASR